MSDTLITIVSHFFFHQTPSDPYVCGVLRLTPQAIGSLDVMAHLSNAPISSLSDCEVGCLRSAVQLEVFSPVTLDSVADIPWVPTPPAAIAEFDRHIDSPFTIAVGSSVNLAIRGGPPSIGHVHSEILVDTQTPGKTSILFIPRMYRTNVLSF